MRYTRYEVFDTEGRCYDGFMHRYYRLDLPHIVRHNIDAFWGKNLLAPPTFDCEAKCYFTPQGLKRFKKNIETLKRLYSKYFYLGAGMFDCIMDVKETYIEIDDLQIDSILYQDDYQIVIRI